MDMVCAAGFFLPEFSEKSAATLSKSFHSDLISEIRCELGSHLSWAGKEFRLPHEKESRDAIWLQDKENQHPPAAAVNSVIRS